MDTRSWSCRSSKDVIRLGGPTKEEYVAAAVFSGCCGGKPTWWRVRAAWNSLVRRSRRRRGGYYDAYTYALNFDQGTCNEEEEVEILSRSFSMRYADPSRFHFLKQQMGLLDL